MMNKYGKETSGAGVLNYHSSHEERIAASPQLHDILCERDRPPRGIIGKLFGKNKGARLTFLNIVALVLLFVFYQITISRNPAGNWRSEGFQFSVSAFARAGTVLVSVRITKEKTEVPRESSAEITLQSAGVSETFTPSLPLKKGEVAYVRTGLPLRDAEDSKPRKIFCRIVFGETAKDLSVPVKEE